MITTSPIKPTIGRIVYVRSSSYLHATGPDAYAPAIVNAVHSDSCVSVTAFPFAAAPVAVTSLPYAEPEGDEALPDTGWWWMPFQKTVAAERDPTTGQPRQPLSEMRFGGGDVDKAPEPA